jgi:hypothetical protein
MLAVEEQWEQVVAQLLSEETLEQDMHTAVEIICNQVGQDSDLLFLMILRIAQSLTILEFQLDQANTQMFKDLIFLLLGVEWATDMQAFKEFFQAILSEHIQEDSARHTTQPCRVLVVGETALLQGQELSALSDQELAA